MEVSGDGHILRRLYFRQGADLDVLVEYGDLRYHLLLQYNVDKENCAENETLRRVGLYTALDEEDEDALDNAWEDFFELIFPFVEADHAKRTGSNTTQTSSRIHKRILRRSFSITSKTPNYCGTWR